MVYGLTLSCPTIVLQIETYFLWTFSIVKIPHE